MELVVKLTGPYADELAALRGFDRVRYMLTFARYTKPLINNILVDAGYDVEVTSVVVKP